MTGFPAAPLAGAERPARYLHLIAEVAGRLLAASDPATMVDETFALIEGELRLDVFVNFTFDDRGRLLRLEASGGLSEEQQRAIATLELGQAVCGCVARDRSPAHVAAIQRSDDPRAAFVRDIGLGAYACTPLMVGDRLIGTLSFGRRWSESFDPEELQFLHMICHYVALAKQRLHIERELRRGVDTRERLLAELNHRVRNSLQLVTGLIAMETAATRSVEARASLDRVGDRVLTVAAVHQRLYSGGEPDRIEIEALLESLARDMAGDAGVPIRFHVDGQHWLGVEKAVALALAFDELVRPLLADRPGGDAGIGFNIYVDGEDRLCLRIADSARKPVEIDDKVLRALLRQLRGTIEGDAEIGDLTLRLPVAGRAR